jgi:type IX secretion system PorP/SprF family membrane protein
MSCRRRVYLAGWLALGLLRLGSPAAKAQDWHFSQFQANPQAVDPSLTGTMEGRLRAVAQYRNQWQFAGGFHTLGFALDAPFARSRAGDHFGIGFQALVDQAGDLAYRTTQMSTGLAYHKVLGGAPAHFLSLGFQAGWGQRSIDWTRVQAFDPEPASLLASGRVNYLDLAAGLSWYRATAENRFLYGGAALFHPHRPDLSFRSDGTDPLAMRQVVYAGASWPLGRVVFAQPAAVFMRQGVHREGNLGMNLKWWLNPDRQLYQTQRALYAGVWYRWDDALIATVRMDFRDVTVGLSYDVNISTLGEASRGMGGPEISLQYLLGPSASGGARQRSYQQVVCPNFF